MFKRWKERRRQRRLEEIRAEIANSEALQMLALIISIRGEFMYYLSYKLSENANKPDFEKLYGNEKKLLKERLLTLWKDKPASQVENIINGFYGKG